MADTYAAFTLLRMAAVGQMPTGLLVTRTVLLDCMEAYDVFFGRVADNGALKVVLGGQQHEADAVRAA